MLTGVGFEVVSWPDAAPTPAVAKVSNGNSVLADFMDQFPLRLAWAVAAVLTTASVFAAAPPGAGGNVMMRNP